MRFSRKGAAPSYFLLRRWFRERRVFVGRKRLILIQASSAARCGGMVAVL